MYICLWHSFSIYISLYKIIFCVSIWYQSRQKPYINTSQNQRSAACKVFIMSIFAHVHCTRAPLYRLWLFFFFLFCFNIISSKSSMHCRHQNNMSVTNIPHRTPLLHRKPRRGGCSVYPQSMFWAKLLKISNILRWNFQFLLWKNSLYIAWASFRNGTRFRWATPWETLS